MQEYERWEVPTTVHDFIPGLPVHSDGLLSARASECGYVVRSVGMRRHWREKHRWKPSSSKGRPRAAASDTAQQQQQAQQFSRIVTYQQAFNQGTVRHYIHAQGRSTDQNTPVEPQADEMMKNLREHRMAGTWEGESAMDGSFALRNPHVI
jgi:hypothetical protein